MIATTFNILILLIGLTWFIYLAYQQRSGVFVLITPFALFGFNEITALWGIPLSYAFKDQSLGAGEILIIGTAFFAFILGFFVTGKSSSPIKSYLAQPITAKHSVQYYFMGVAFCTALLVFLGIYYYQGVPALGFSLIEFAMGNMSLGEMASFMSEQRFQLTKSHWFGGAYRGQGIINIVQQIGWRFVAAVSLIMYLTLRSKRWLFLTILTFFLLIIFQAGTGERAPLLASVMFLAVMLSMMQKIKPKHFLFLGVLGFSFLMATTYFSAKGGASKDAPDYVSKLASQLVERIFLGNAIHDLEIIEHVETGRMKKRIGMWHFEKFVSSFPGLRLGEPLGFRVSYLRGSPETTFSSGTYMGFVYADFGYSGVLIIFFLIGSFLAYAQKQIFTKERDIILIVMSAMVILYLSYMTATGPIGFASNMVMVFLFWGIFHFFGIIFSAKHTSISSTPNFEAKNKLSLP